MLAEPAPTLDLGVKDIVSLREMMKVDPELKPDPAIKVALDKKMEFYRITLVADFAPGKNAKFVQAQISVRLESGLYITSLFDCASASRREAKSDKDMGGQS